jgi:acyl-CoA synthetase (NDP forming)
VGESEAGVRAARSHTGALVSDTLAVDAACRAAGIVRAATPRELADLAQALADGVRPRGRRIAVVGDGGGHGVVAADVSVSAGLQVPPLSDHLAGRLAEPLPPRASTRNPIDTAGGEQDLWAYERILRIVLGSGEADAALLTGYFGGYGQDENLGERELEVARALPRVAADTGQPLVAHTMYARSPAAAALRAGGVPVYREIEAAARTLARLAAWGERPPGGVPSMPPRAAAVVAETGYLAARELLVEAGVRFPPARRAETAAEAKHAAREIGYPVVLKALGILHKSDAGGVALGLEDEAALEDALSKMATLHVEAYAVERMERVGAGIELIAGCRWDRRFGPIAMVGLGGLHAEVLRDVAVALAPVDAEEAEMLVRSVRGAPVLLGARGRPPVDIGAAARAVATLTAVAARHPEIAEIEINPLLATPDGALGLDARIVLADPRKRGEAHAR